MTPGADRTIRLADGRRLGYSEFGDREGAPVIYFHGWPGARVEARLGDDAARLSGVRLIAIDRPGMGLSTFQPNRKLLDWPDDVVEAAARLGLNRFAVLGISGGGPYAAACAWKLPDRLTCAGIVSSLAPFDVPGAVASMGRRNRMAFKLVQRLSVLRRILMARAAWLVSRRPERVLESGVTAAEDAKYLDRPNVRNVLEDSLREAFRGGSRGPAWEMGVYAKPWRFRLEEIRVPVHVWHGEDDVNAPISMGRYLGTSIPGCRATFYPGEAHLHFVDRLAEILAALSAEQGVV
jgi:pimeloyl-ACP methyl ester carboxylesterase